MDGKSLTPQEIKLKELKAIFPEVFSENKVDWEKLKATLGEDINFNNERYVLNWAGKSEAFKVLQSPTTKTLVPDKNESVQFDNTQHIFIEGENLEVLKVLQKSYFGKVKMIYIDPPYNTGNDSFIYPDKFSESKAEYEKRVGDKDSDGFLTKDGFFRKNSKENGQYHSNWLNMMYPRMFLAKNLLRKDGVIFVSIDDNEVHNLRLLMNEVFGEENFVGQLAVQLNPRGRNLDKFIAQTHESILIFTKNFNNNNSMYGVQKTGRMLLEYNKVDKNGKYRLIGLRNRNQAFNPKTRPNLFYPLYVDSKTFRVSVNKSNTFSKEVYPSTSEGVKTCWTWGKAKVTAMNNLLIAEPFGSEWRIYRKDYLFDKEGNSSTTLIKSLWVDKDINNDYGKKSIKKLFGSSVMSFPKSPVLIRKLLKAGMRKSDLFLDFFTGSGTTAHAVMALNAQDGGSRQHISVQLPELTDEKSEAHKAGYKTIADIAKERIRRAGQKIQSEIDEKIKEKTKEIKDLESQLALDGKDEKIKTLQAEIEQLQNQDLGFKVLKLTDSNFKQWQQLGNSDAKALEKQMKLFVNPIAESSTAEKMVYELLLKSGKDLNSTIEHTGDYYRVNGAELILMLEKATQEIVDSIVSEQPTKVIALDILFQGNDQLKTNTSLQMKDAGIEFKTI